MWFKGEFRRPQAIQGKLSPICDCLERWKLGRIPAELAELVTAYGVLGFIPALRRPCYNLEFDPRSRRIYVEELLPVLSL